MVRTTNLSLSSIWSSVQMQLPGLIGGWAAQAVLTQLPALVFPGAGLIKAIWQTIRFVFEQAGAIFAFLAPVGKALSVALQAAASVATQVVTALKAGAGLLLKFLGCWLGITDLVQRITGHGFKRPAECVKYHAHTI